MNSREIQIFAAGAAAGIAAAWLLFKSNGGKKVAARTV
jgi:hypothetical protein